MVNTTQTEYKFTRLNSITLSCADKMVPLLWTQGVHLSHTTSDCNSSLYKKNFNIKIKKKNNYYVMFLVIETWQIDISD